MNMRLAERSITREEMLDTIDTLEIIEAYPEDKYLPSYLLYGATEAKIFHVVIATDVVQDHVRIVTAYEPDPDKWDPALKVRRKKL